MNLPDLVLSAPPSCCPVFFLTGPTASGKSDAAHALAAHYGMRVLSMDSMMVYRGMDIGTAKPALAERRRFDYAGLDLVDPDQRFSTGRFLQAVGAQLDARPTLAVGGTGLYFQTLELGLAPAPPVDTRLRAELEGLSLEELAERLRNLAPTERIGADILENPRRLIRAIEWHVSGRAVPRRSASVTRSIPVLHWEREALNRRIMARVDAMYRQGLVDEVASLRPMLAQGVGTARQAIGYAEALNVLGGGCSESDARERTAARTRQYAKRQRTWFRNQMSAVWISCQREGGQPNILTAIAKVWAETGPHHIPYA